MKKISKNNLNDVFKCKLVSEELAVLQGYELIKEFFVDSSGFGQDFEPALTSNSFLKELEKLIEKKGSVYCSITNAGQFQVYIGVFKKIGKSTVKKMYGKVATYIIDSDSEYSIIYHDTKVFKHDKVNNCIILDSGGYETKTTKERINNELRGFGYDLVQKNYERYVVESMIKGEYNYIKGKKDLLKQIDAGSIIEFKDGLKINL